VSQQAISLPPRANLSGVQAEIEEQQSTSLRDHEQLLTEAYAYLHLLQQECGPASVPPKRFAEIQTQIEGSGTYEHTCQELVYGAKVAWRNNTHCIGRLHWQSLTVHDRRHLSQAQDIFEAIIEHIDYATNGGKIRPVITIFAPQQPHQSGIRIWNPQYIRYAGYQQADGSIIGDPLQVELTQAIRRLGWKGGKGTPFDVLPLVIQMPDQPPQLFELPPQAVLEVPISHPVYPCFAELGLRWHALPAISNMRMEIGGISYTAAPFNGWYMGTEIGARNLADVNRYNMLPVIAKHLGLDTRSDRSLWKDQALVELNRAVLHSFATLGITIVDHHTATRQFICHEELEQQAGRTVPAHWAWIVPPMSGSATPVFHRFHYKNTTLKPNFFYQRAPWQEPLHGSS
jgi:nitric-oxide synthase, bacterial